jgi:hypothetical protein
MSAGIAGHCDYLLDNVIHASVSEIALQIEYLIAWYNKSNSLIAKINLQSRCEYLHLASQCSTVYLD